MREPEQHENALPPDVPDSGAGVKRPRRPRLFTIIALAILGLAAIGGGIGGLIWGHTRKPTPAQVSAAGDRAYANQWRWLTAGKIFPAKVSYLNALDLHATATLVGIAPAAPCARAVDAKAARMLAKAGCVTMLRATYADTSRTVLTTIGIAVLPDQKAASAALATINDAKAGGLLPVSFPKTIAGSFTKSARETYDGELLSGPYLIFSATGYADGRKTTQKPSRNLPDTAEQITSGMPKGMVSVFETALAATDKPCTVREVRC